METRPFTREHGKKDGHDGLFPKTELRRHTFASALRSHHDAFPSIAMFYAVQHHVPLPAEGPLGPRPVPQLSASPSPPAPQTIDPRTDVREDAYEMQAKYTTRVRSCGKTPPLSERIIESKLADESAPSLPVRERPPWSSKVLTKPWIGEWSQKHCNLKKFECQ